MIADLVWKNPASSGNTQFKQVGLLGPDCDQETNSCATDMMSNRRFYVRGDVDHMSLVLVNTAKDRSGADLAKFEAAFGRVNVSDQHEVLAQLSSCMASLVLCLISLYISAFIASNLDGRLFAGDSLKKDKKPVVTKSKMENQITDVSGGEEEEGLLS